MDTNKRYEIVERMVEVMTRLNKTQGAVSRDIKVSRTLISRVVKGERKPTENTISKFCSAYNVNRDWLLTGEGDMFNDEESGIAKLRRELNNKINQYESGSYVADTIPKRIALIKLITEIPDNKIGVLYALADAFVNGESL